jgi:hypothetical protein
LVFDVAHHNALKSSGTSPNFQIAEITCGRCCAAERDGADVTLNASPRLALLPHRNNFFDSFEEHPIPIYVRPATFSIHAFPVTGKGDLQVGPASLMVPIGRGFIAGAVTDSERSSPGRWPVRPAGYRPASFRYAWLHSMPASRV